MHLARQADDEAEDERVARDDDEAGRQDLHQGDGDDAPLLGGQEDAPQQLGHVARGREGKAWDGTGGGDSAGQQQDCHHIGPLGHSLVGVVVAHHDVAVNSNERRVP